MKNQAPWVGKVFDEPRVGFVAEYGSQRHPLVQQAAPAEPPPRPASSPLDKIIDEDRRGFVVEQRATTEQPRRRLAVRMDKRP